MVKEQRDRSIWFEEAVTSPQKTEWSQAMKDEIDLFKERHVFREVEAPRNEKVLGTKWVYKLKKDEQGHVKKYRARLVAQGFRQTQGVDYNEVFSPVVNYVLIRLFFCLLVGLLGWLDLHLDVKGAYLYGDLDHKIHISIPEGFTTAARKGLVA